MNSNYKKYINIAIWAQLVFFIIAFWYVDTYYQDDITDYYQRIMLYILAIDAMVSAYLFEKFAVDPEVHHRRIIKYYPLVLIQFVIAIVIILTSRFQLDLTPSQVTFFNGFLFFELFFTVFYIYFFLKRARSFIHNVQMSDQARETIDEIHPSIRQAQIIILILLVIPAIIVWILLSSLQQAIF